MNRFRNDDGDVTTLHPRCLFANINSGDDYIPTGRVEDIDEWIRMSSESLQKITGNSIYDYMDDDDEVTDISQIHNHERYAVLSHGTQEDPIYCYFNKAAFLQFKWSEDEIYQLPSRYSAPSGYDRDTREKDIEKSVLEDYSELSSVVRQTKDGELFEMVNVILWNVYDDDGQRIGQTALYDRNLVRPVEKTKETDG